MYQEQHWFKLWIKESYSIRQLCYLSGHSRSKLERINQYWLSKEPQELKDLSPYQYMLFDGTYFHKDGCLVCFVDALTKTVISSIYTDREGYHSVYEWFKELRSRGMNPRIITVDGNQSIIRAIHEVWPSVKIQRCLFHIQREGMRWLRTYPKTTAGQELRDILDTLCHVKSYNEKDQFIQTFRSWHTKHYAYVKSLPSTTVAYKDLKKTITLIVNALPDMFHYLDNALVPATTNILEGFFSRLKSDYRRHRGLTRHHRICYLKWYCFFQNSNIF